jgi:hypothetical protein
MEDVMLLKNCGQFTFLGILFARCGFVVSESF